MTLFVSTFALAFLSALWLVTGLGHGLAWNRFRRTITSHRVIPPLWGLLAAAVIPPAELGLGIGALGSLARNGSLPAWVSLGSAALALVFGLYLVGLLRRGPAPGVSCGCSPLAGPLTPLSLLPALAVGIASLAGGAAASVDVAGVAAELPPGASVLAALWGLTLAGLVLLIPAAASAASLSHVPSEVTP